MSITGIIIVVGCVLGAIVGNNIFSSGTWIGSPIGLAGTRFKYILFGFFAGGIAAQGLLHIIGLK